MSDSVSLSRQKDISPRENQEQMVQSSFPCNSCPKSFSKNQDLQTHKRMKHAKIKKNKKNDEESYSEQYRKAQPKSVKPSTKKSSIKNRMLQNNQNEIEDNIYAFLGQLGEKNIEFDVRRDEVLSTDQKNNGHTNYSLNKVVRTPYEEPIKASAQVQTIKTDDLPLKQFFQILKKQMKILQQKLQSQQDMWELRDPMGPQEQTKDEFSLMDIAKLVQNYPKRNVNIQYPCFSIFMLWIGRICKPPAFKQFYQIVGEYLGQYLSFPQSKVKGDDAYQTWNNFYKKWEETPLNEQSTKRLSICNQGTIRQMCQYFSQWVHMFHAFDI